MSNLTRDSSNSCDPWFPDVAQQKDFMKLACWLAVVAFMSLIAGLPWQTCRAAPKQAQETIPFEQTWQSPPILQRHFDKSDVLRGVKAQTVDEASGPVVRYVLNLKSGATVVFGEKPKIGQAWVWARVLELSSAPPPGFFEQLARENDDSIGPFLSWAGDQSGAGVVYLNYFFLMETATPTALEKYVELMASEQRYLEGKLNEWLAKNRAGSSPR